MSRARVRLEPRGETLELPDGAGLREPLFARGVEFPCGGHGRCRGCALRVRGGAPPPNAAERAALDPAELDRGWRLACQLRARDGLALELGASGAAPCTDDGGLVAVAPRDGLGVAIDLGTTTIAAQLVDLRTGLVLAGDATLNPQGSRGADVMSRLEATRDADGAAWLTGTIRSHLAAVVARLLRRSDADRLVEVVVVGNTAMRDLACGLDVAGLRALPFESAHRGEVAFRARELGWSPADAVVRFLPPVGGFVGSDALAGALAVGLGAGGARRALIDLGTNGEVLVGDARGLACASTAAGPAFEGARIRHGMRAAAGAIHRVDAGTPLRCAVLGDAPARGICGSGLVDAVAAALDLGLVQVDGRLSEPVPLAENVALFPADVRELQLAKAAISAGLGVLLAHGGASPDDLTAIDLAGAFGNQVRPLSAVRIGLLPPPPDRVRAAGNTALRGARMILAAGPAGLDAYDALLRRTVHVPLAADRSFVERFVDALAFAN